MNSETFVVNDNSDPEAAKLALKELKRMVKYGDMARAALQKLKRDGFYDELVPVVEEPTRRRYEVDRFKASGYGTNKTSSILFIRLPKRLDISRSDLGDMFQLQVELGTHDGKEVELFVKGPIAYQVSQQSVYKIREGRHPIGSVRINKGNLLWISNIGASFAKKGTFQLYKELKYSGARTSMEAFSRGVSKILAMVEPDGLPLATAKTLDLQNNAWQWFLEDGHAERMFRDIHELIRVFEVMRS